MSNRIYLRPEVRSGLGEDTFWLWAERELPNATFDDPRWIDLDDIVLQYSTLGPIRHKDARGIGVELAGQAHPGTVALCWELYPEMRLQLGSSEWDSTIRRTESCAANCGRRVVSTEFARPFYERFGKVDVLPIGVDCDLFKPLPDKQGLREKYELPANGRLGLWCGTAHRMKGFDLLLHCARGNPHIWWIVVWKSRQDAKIARKRYGDLLPCSHFVQVPQRQLSELMSAADFFASTSRLRPFYMVEWEAMACDLPFANFSGIEKDFDAERVSSTRDELFRRGWDRTAAKKAWLEYLGL